MTRWPTAKHFTSWLTLGQGSKISGGKVLSARTRRSVNRATALLRLCAITIGKSQTALGVFFRRLAARTGKANAVTATARKIAVLFYNTLRHGMSYVDPGAEYYEERYRRRTLDNLGRRADSLGFRLVPARRFGRRKPSIPLPASSKFQSSYRGRPRCGSLRPMLDDLLALERAALARWGRGDPDGYLDLSADDVTYFDPFVERRLDGLGALADWYRPLRGTIHVDRDEFVAPHAQRFGDVAVLTFQLVSESRGATLRWNCTEVYAQRDQGWKLVHTHWSFTKAGG